MTNSQKGKTNDLQGFINTNKNTKQLTVSFLEQHNILKIKDKNEQLVAVVKAVGEIPWGMGRTIEEVLTTKKVGTCTGKHRVLQECLKELDIEYKPVVCTFKWSQQDIVYPKGLQAILDQGEEWKHGHNFVKVKKPSDGKWIDIDINWDSPLAEFGFITAINWNGESNLVAVKKVAQRWDDVDIGNMKVKLIESLSTDQRKRRKRFLDGFVKWIDSIRN